MDGLNLLLDSGAFSAWNNGKAIDLDHYIAFIKANIEHIEHYVNLDVIPGEFGRTPSPSEVEVSAEQGWANMLRMEAEGLRPIPVFHMGEQFKWLRRMVEHGCPYIGISPANDRPTKAKAVWLDRVFDQITDAAGWPLVRTHAFGVTSIDLLIRYPWYSADSTTWIMIAARGKILLPRWENDAWNFNRRPSICYVSEPHLGAEDLTAKQRAEAVKRSLEQSQWRHITAERKHVEDWLAFCDSSLELCEVDYIERTRVCLRFFLEFEKQHVDQPFKRTKQHLFEDD